MLIIKQIPVIINFLNGRIKKRFGDVMLKNDINLTAEQYLVMDILWDEGILSQQAIADILQKDKNSVTKFIDSLENKGLVSRATDKVDRRVNNIVVSDKGQKLKERATEVAIETMNVILNDVTEEEMKVCLEVLNKIRKNMEK